MDSVRWEILTSHLPTEFPEFPELLEFLDFSVGPVEGSSPRLTEPACAHGSGRGRLRADSMCPTGKGSAR